MSIKAYTRTLKNTEEPRQIERRLLSRATAALEAHQERFDQASERERAMMLTADLKSALWTNQQIWMALKTDLALPENALQSDLRAGLLSLAIWVDRQTQSVLGGRGAIRPLLDINHNIIEGLAATSRPALQAQGA